MEQAAVQMQALMHDELNRYTESIQQTLYMSISSPPTPAPSPDPYSHDSSVMSAPSALRKHYLSTILSTCTPAELLFISTTIAPLLKRDFLRSLPTELALHVLEFIDDVPTLGRIARVSRYWENLVRDEGIWRRMYDIWGFDSHELHPPYSYHQLFQSSYAMTMNWKHGPGRLLRAHRLPSSAVVTSLALDNEWVVVGLANAQIHVFSAKTGELARTLVGHNAGVWSVGLISAGGHNLNNDGEEDSEITDFPPSLRTTLGFDLPHTEYHPHSDISCSNSNSSAGWGQPNALVVSGGCDKTLRVWDVLSGLSIHALHGHSGTIRCLKTVPNYPIAVTGSRDATLRVWNVQKGRLLRMLVGHTGSVRCLDVWVDDKDGVRIVSGSYDTTCRIWDGDTGECLHVLQGHFQQVYSVVCDGTRIASGGLDTTVRVWDARNGTCLALLQGHTALVCQLQLSSTMLVTGGSDGRVITFSSDGYTALHKIAAHDSSVTALQFDEMVLVTGGNDGRVRVWDVQTGVYLRELSAASEGVWKVAYRAGVCALMCRRKGRTVVEVWRMG